MASEKTPTPAEFNDFANKLMDLGKSLPEKERELLGRLLSTSPLRGELSEDELGHVAGGSGGAWNRI